MPKELIQRITPDDAYRERLEVWFGGGVELVAIRDELLEGLSTQDFAGCHIESHRSLNREEINNLIRVLRKARDRTFGSDA